MARAAKGEFLLLLNNDAALLPEALKTLKAESDAISEPAIFTLPQFDARAGSLIDRGALLDPFLNSVPNREMDRRDVAMVAGSCLWIPSETWHKLGGFPEWFGSLAEDLYVCCRARLSGIAVRVAGSSGYRHRVGHSLGGGIARDGRLSTNWQRRRLSERNKAFVAWIIWPSPWVPLALGLHLSFLVIECTLLATIRRDMRYLTRIYTPLLRSLWNDRSRLRSIRRDVQASRRIGIVEFLRRFVPYPQKAVLLWRYGLPDLS
jgi:GT2 family glycosyltransferase